MAMIGGWPPWMRALAVIGQQCGGVFRVLPVIEADVNILKADALTGRLDAVYTLGAIAASEEWIHHPQPDTPAMPCLACQQPIAGKHRAYGVVVPDVSSPEVLVALPVCVTCAPNKDAILPALEGCLRTVWPAYRLIGPVMPTSGRA